LAKAVQRPQWEMQCDPWSCRRSWSVDLTFFLWDGGNPQWHQLTTSISYVCKIDQGTIPSS
jgi:hypothetical protein